MVQRSFLSDLKKVEDNLVEVRKVFLEKLANEAVVTSPVDTGAYVRSHSIGTSTGLGGKQSSHGKPKDNGTARADAIDKLLSQIASIPDGATQVFMGNRSPHASAVENGWPTKDGYHVYTVLRAKAPTFIQEAKNQVWGKQ